jgi:NMD protein affecting ribosome stability and mRNA decay
MRSATCLHCGVFGRTVAKGLCNRCYLRQKVGLCVRCGVVKPRAARGLCRACYQRDHMGVCSGCGGSNGRMPRTRGGVCTPCLKAEKRRRLLEG